MKIADDAQSIKARLEEIQQERMQAIMGKPIEETQAVEAPADISFGMWGASINDAARLYLSGQSDDLPTA